MYRILFSLLYRTTEDRTLKFRSENVSVREEGDYNSRRDYLRCLSIKSLVRHINLFSYHVLGVVI